MSTKQTRRSISVSEGAYQKLRGHSEATGKPMSQIVEDWIETHLSLPSPGRLPPLKGEP